ncbi:unnamed protein product [Phyllotreta striolata]|uniref:DED domain-containing protein n=1 Tax=Phyllotreta striolata TaxID=444603 RepID=A0A9N9U2D9_PHYSR|nr:unnamed protein product [Phyllotreta striolata]
MNNNSADSNEIENIKPTKKARKFSAKEFRKQLATSNVSNALQQFSEAINNDNKHDYVLDYLEAGGNCLELLQILEQNSTISPVAIFDVISLILLKISSSYPQYRSSAYESCRYLLNNYITVINKMLNMSSTTPERKSCLKLLTSMVAFSPVLAKDILINVSFHTANIELLTKHTGEKNSVRDNFIKFLTAYLVDGHYPALSTLLEKKGFITSIIQGLKYDSVDTLCLVVSAMKTFILENPYVSKTAKMKTFNTVVIKDVVNLYNWTGPAGFKATKKNNRATLVKPDNVEKAKVNEALHDFLLKLCTSHKHGIIFRDHSVGLGKKNQNALMYTVLEGLERPWEHSYASELVTKICGACPDLAKNVWGNLKSSLEPRMSPKWIAAVKFSVNLLNELHPNCIEFCIKELNEIQLFQIVQCLVLPLPILKTIIPEKLVYDCSSIKQYVNWLLLEMLKSVRNYLVASREFLSEEKQAKFEFLINKHVSKNFPDALTFLNNWDQLDENSPFTDLRNLEIIIDTFNLYKTISPELLNDLSNNDSELCNLLEYNKTEGFDESLSNLQVKIIDLFVDLDPSKFLVKSNMFSSVVPLLLKIYYHNPKGDSNTLRVLNKLLKNTGLFDGCPHEINVWINGVLDAKNWDQELARAIVETFQLTDNDVLGLLEKLSAIQTETNREKHYSETIRNLMNQTGVTAKEIQKYPVGHKYLSPVVLGYVEYLKRANPTKSLKAYSSFIFANLLHSQTNFEPIAALINEADVPEALKEYCNCWLSGEKTPSLPKSKGRIAVLRECSEEFLSGDVEKYAKTADIDFYSDLKLNLLDMVLFYVVNLINNDCLSSDVADKCENFIKLLPNNDKDVVERILCHPVLARNTKFLHLNQSNCTKLMVNVTKDLAASNRDLDLYLNVYREKLLHSILKILKKPQKFEENPPDIKTLMHIYSLGYEECSIILETIGRYFDKYSNHEVIVEILSYSLQQFTQKCLSNANLEPINEETATKLTDYFAILAKHQPQLTSALSSTFLEYLEVFPHTLNFINSDLFETLLQIEDSPKDNIKLITYILKTNCSAHMESVRRNLEKISEKKALLLPILSVLSKEQIEEDFYKRTYNLVETSLKKTLQKPQKAGQHFHQHYDGLVELIRVAAPVEACKSFWEKVQKFDASEIYHVHLLKALCSKSLSESTTDKEINSILLTFVHLQLHLFKKTDADLAKAEEIASQITQVFDALKPIAIGRDLKAVAKNESVKLYVKFCLKYGVSSRPAFLKSLKTVLEILRESLDNEEARLILDMLTSHSEFLDVMLGEHGDTKAELLELYLIICKNWPEFMERNFVPLLLASYTARVNKCDRIILLLLKMFESAPDRTHFYDFKPFLWGKSAATQYSVKNRIENALLRQPKTGDVLDILQEDLVCSTITRYPFSDRLRPDERDLLDVPEAKSYDLLFLLPLFSQLLAPEQQVLTYKFTRSGALSLTVIGLSSADEEVRRAACHVLARFHYHVEARQTGKDNLLWIRYVEAVCKGTAALPDFKLNNFAAIYLARMALILTQPNHVMYLPLSQHLAAKASLDFSTVPELYTFLHSSEVNYKEHRTFTLELLRDGLRTEKDFSDFMRSMAFKLFSELYCSEVCDADGNIVAVGPYKSFFGNWLCCSSSCASDLGPCPLNNDCCGRCARLLSNGLLFLNWPGKFGVQLLLNNE